MFEYPLIRGYNMRGGKPVSYRRANSYVTQKETTADANNLQITYTMDDSPPKLLYKQI